MSDCPIRTLTLSLPEDTYQNVLRLTQRQNANFDNNVSRLLNLAVEETYKRWPNLSLPQEERG